MTSRKGRDGACAVQPEFFLDERGYFCSSTRPQAAILTGLLQPTQQFVTSPEVLGRADAPQRFSASTRVASPMAWLRAVSYRGQCEQPTGLSAPECSLVVQSVFMWRGYSGGNNHSTERSAEWTKFTSSVHRPSR
jgi:hypothetical protein